MARVVELAHQLQGELAPMRGGRIWAAHDARREPLEPTLAALLDDPDACVQRRH